MKRVLFIGIVLLAVMLTACGGHSKSASSKGADTIALTPCPKFMADSAFKFVEEQCAFGPRVTGSKEALACGDYIINRFRAYGAKVEEQLTTVIIWDGTELPARNIVASINPENRDRIMFCAHWDSRPWADNDPDEAKHHTPLLGANDGASGVAVMLELCRLLQQQKVNVGVDFVCFDAEDLGTPEWADDVEDTSDTWCLGSKQWAQRARENDYRARYGILLDMVGGRGNTFHREQISLEYAQPVVDLIWHLAAQLGYGHFFPLSNGGRLIDDHVHVNSIARVPCLDIVPYYTEGPSSFGPTWHTVSDTPDNIDTNVLEAVGQTLTQLIYNED